MAVTMDLCENGHILYFTITDPWTLNNLTTYFPEEQRCRDHASYKIHSLFNVLSTKTVPPLLLTARNSPSLIHANHGHLVVVGAVPIIHTVAEIAFKLTGFTQGRFLSTEEEGWAFLRQIIADESKTDYPTP